MANLLLEREQLMEKKTSSSDELTTASVLGRRRLPRFTISSEMTCVFGELTAETKPVSQTVTADDQI